MHSTPEDLLQHPTVGTGQLMFVDAILVIDYSGRVVCCSLSKELYGYGQVVETRAIVYFLFLLFAQISLSIYCAHVNFVLVILLCNSINGHVDRNAQ